MIEYFERKRNIHKKFFLTFRSYKAAHPDHLSVAFNTAAHKNPEVIPSSVDFKDIIDSWSNQKGFPILYVDFNPEAGTINLTQHRYLTNFLADPDRLVWWIPYNFITESEAKLIENQKTTPDNWLNTANAKIESSEARNLKSEKWVLFNKQQTGYYRVNYDADNWNALANALLGDDYKNIPLLSRAQLISDSMDFARTGRISYEIPMKILTYLGKTETEYFPWETTNTELNRIRNRIAWSSFSENYMVGLI